MRKNIGVMAWNWRSLGPKVEELEKRGDRATGMQIAQLSGYSYESFDEIHLVDYSPEAVEQWTQMAQAAGEEMTAKVVLPPKPADAFEAPAELPKRSKPRNKSKASVSNSPPVDESE